jgi:hypothetical protein
VEYDISDGAVTGTFPGGPGPVTSGSLTVNVQTSCTNCTATLVSLTVAAGSPAYALPSVPLVGFGHQTIAGALAFMGGITTFTTQTTPGLSYFRFFHNVNLSVTTGTTAVAGIWSAGTRQHPPGGTFSPVTNVRFTVNVTGQEVAVPAPGPAPLQALGGLLLAAYGWRRLRA